MAMEMEAVDAGCLGLLACLRFLEGRVVVTSAVVEGWG
jgi:hypothetical protein